MTGTHARRGPRPCPWESSCHICLLSEDEPGQWDFSPASGTGSSLMCLWVQSGISLNHREETGFDSIRGSRQECLPQIAIQHALLEERVGLRNGFPKDVCPSAEPPVSCV